MLYDPDEFIFLYSFFDALRDALRCHPEYRKSADYYAGLGRSIREGDLPIEKLQQIKEALILGTFLDQYCQDCEEKAEMQQRRVKTLIHTIHLLKETAP